MNIRVIEKLYEDLKGCKNLAFVSIISSSGSTPRDTGSNMIVYEDGSVYGSIGGGIVEKKVIEEAVECIKKRESKKLEFKLTPDGVDALCGGEVEVFIDVYFSDIEVILLGAGHVSIAVAHILEFLSIPYRVVDERKDLASPINFPKAVEILNILPYRFNERINIDERHYIVILTRGHLYDEKCLVRALKTKAAYIGMIGSVLKVKEIYKRIGKRGLSDDKRVYAPIGINCGGKTPNEIAISIACEILSVRYSKTVSHMRSLIE